MGAIRYRRLRFERMWVFLGRCPERNAAGDDLDTLQWHGDSRGGFCGKKEMAMSAVVKLVIAGMLFLGTGLCIYGFLAEKLVDLSIFGLVAASAGCAGVFIYFAFFDPAK